jgi:hypothetical protein
MNKREPLIMIAVGTKGVGKTYTTRKEIAHQVIVNKRKVLIYDASLDPELVRYKTLHKNFLSSFVKSRKPEIRRILAVDDYGNELPTEQKIELLRYILENFKGGILVLEDFNKYVTNPNELQELIGIITTNRHRNLDIIFHYQSLRAVTTRMFQNTRCFRLHKDLESPDTFKERLADKYELFKIASIIIDTEYRKGTEAGKRFYLYVLTDDFKIIGASDKQFESACKKYLWANKSLIKRIRDEQNLTSDEQAIKFFIEDRKNLYLK